MPAKRKSITKKVRFEVFKRDKFQCQYCGNSAPEVILNVDHIKPVSKGGDNSISNLITSCFSCNSGKSDRELSDDSAIQKQKKQLIELAERREQIELMLEWREGLSDLDKLQEDKIAEYWSNEVVCGQYSVSEHGRKKIKAMLKKFNIKEIMDAMDLSGDQYLKADHEGSYTQDSVNKAFNKVHAILKNKNQPPYIHEIYYIRGILRNRLSYINEWKAVELMKNAYENGLDTDTMKAISLECASWTDFVEIISEMAMEVLDNG